ncbi:RNA-binding domain-containing protein [Serendipita vermifera]|nr:RNA-binding domain-containing protein [Serendipita vermifera]
MGRPVYLREDREMESRFGATPVPGKIGMAMAGSNYSGVPPPRTSHSSSTGASGNPGNQLYVGNLPYQAGWQDLKDLFRNAGNIIRADINIGIDGRAKGSGTVVFETANDAKNAISMYHGYEWYGRVLEVREDRYAGLHGSRGRGAPRGGGGGPGRGGGGFGSRGGGGGGGGGFGGRGGPGGGYGRGGGRSGDPYGDYQSPSYGSNGGYNNNGYARDLQPSQQIMVRNLPWSTANEDLVELFETTGQVEQAEILYDGTRSKGAGVVQFTHIEEAETAITKFSGYMYGGRPLDVQFNDRWHHFTPQAAKGSMSLA